MVDAGDSKSSAARLASSSLASGTNFPRIMIVRFADRPKRFWRQSRRLRGFVFASENAALDATLGQDGNRRAEGLANGLRVSPCQREGVFAANARID